ncbi:MAG TPA: hypothetical protein VKB47_05115 [Terracidiphilus sp.]|nr:hypothetical protein [Terracidiphilus sp.]
MNVSLAHIEQLLRFALAGLELESGLSYEVQRTKEELILKLLVSDAVTKQRLWELWQGDWPRWGDISGHVPLFTEAKIEWDGMCFSRRIARELPWPLEWPLCN